MKRHEIKGVGCGRERIYARHDHDEHDYWRDQYVSSVQKKYTVGYAYGPHNTQTAPPRAGSIAVKYQWYFDPKWQ